MRPLGTPFVVVLLALASSALTLRAENPVIVHEWGTFTSLQDENGQAIGGINVDDEPVPSFVYTAGQHRVAALNNNPWTFGLPPYSAFQGKGGSLAPVGDPSVTMRLETPVLYIYPPKGQAPASVPPLDVHVDFHGGILSQYYPYAAILGVAAEGNGPVDLSDRTMSGLYWSNVRLGSTAKPVETEDKVWTTPRETSAPELEVRATVFDPSTNQSVATTQAEHFLFYRGLGHLDSPLKTDSASRVFPNASVADGPDHVDFWASPGDAAAESGYSDAWLVQVREDGACAFVHSDLEDKKAKKGWLIPGPDGSGKEGHFAAGNLPMLRASMQAALVKAGLYPDEASAMLRTWELSYFKSPGLRFFYIVPRAWVDKTLPLTVTGAPVAMTRVMVGRIELISDEQKAALARLAKEAYPDLGAVKRVAVVVLTQSPRFTRQEQAEFESGARPLSTLGITLSPSVRDYLSLGRFRDALIAHEQREHPSDNLARFLRENGLAAQ